MEVSTALRLIGSVILRGRELLEVDKEVPRMRVPMAVLKVVMVVPALLMSALLTLAVLALLPPLLAALVAVTIIAGLAVAAAGLGNRPLAAVLTRSRPASAGERSVLAPVFDSIASKMASLAVYVRRTHHPATPAVRIGNDVLVVTPWLVTAIYRRQITIEEAATVVIHANGAHRAGRHRLEIATLLATAPWRCVLATCQTIGHVLAWFPLVRPAWALRGVIGAVAVAQSTVEGHAWAGILAGVLVALTYVVPAANRARERAMLAAGDGLVITHGLGPVLAALLRRSGARLDLDRQIRLEHGPIFETVPAQPAQTSTHTDQP